MPNIGHVFKKLVTLHLPLLLIIGALSFLEGSSTQKGGHGTSIPTYSKNFSVLIIVEQLLPEDSFILVFLHEACNTNDNMFTLDIWRCNSHKLTYLSVLKAFKDTHFHGIIIINKDLPDHLQVEEVLRNLVIFNVLLKDGHKISNVFLFFETYHTFNDRFNRMDEQFHQLSDDAVVVLHELGKYDEQ